MGLAEPGASLDIFLAWIANWSAGIAEDGEGAGEPPRDVYRVANGRGSFVAAADKRSLETGEKGVAAELNRLVAGPVFRLCFLRAPIHLLSLRRRWNRYGDQVPRPASFFLVKGNGIIEVACAAGVGAERRLSVFGNVCV